MGPKLRGSFKPIRGQYFFYLGNHWPQAPRLLPTLAFKKAALILARNHDSFDHHFPTIRVVKSAADGFLRHVYRYLGMVSNYHFYVKNKNLLDPRIKDVDLHGLRLRRGC